MADGFIKISRKIEDWQWYGSPSVCLIWLHILVKANWKDSYFMGYKIPRGSCAISMKSLADECGLSESTVRRGVKRLISTGEISTKGYQKFTLVTVQNYSKYQAKSIIDEKQVNDQVTEQVNDQVTEQVNDQVTEQVNDQVTEQVNDQVTEQVNDNRRIKEYKNLRINKKDMVKSAPSGAEIVDAVDLWFKEFWSLYPKKVGKKPAEQKFKKCCRSETDYTQIMNALRSQIEAKFSHTDMQYIPNPLTWLNQERYKDETVVSAKKNYQERMRELYEQNRNNEDSYVDPFDLSAKQ